MSDIESNGQSSDANIEERVKALEARLSDVETRRREIEASAARVDKLASKMVKVNEDRKLAVKAWEAAVDKHMALCRHWSKSEEVASRPLIAACEAKADPLPADESWRDEPIDVLGACGLSHGLRETLEEQGFHTLGHYADWSRDHDGRLDGIQGIGKAKAEKIADAFSRYWDARAVDVQDADDAEDEDDTDAAEDAEAGTDEGFSRETPVYPDPERSGLDLVTSYPGSDPETNGVEVTEAKPKRSRKAKA